jgi:hypothetical protein
MRWTMTGPCQSGADGCLSIHVSELSAILAARKQLSRRHGHRLASHYNLWTMHTGRGNANNKASQLIAACEPPPQIIADENCRRLGHFKIVEALQRNPGCKQS